MPVRVAARQLGLRPRELDLAIQLDVVRTVPGARGGPRRVAHEELKRVKGAEGFPERLRERLRVVGAEEGARLLGINPSRFARLARAGSFRPVRFYVNRYRAVVWLYLAEELRGFADRSPELLTGRLPASVRAILAEGTDRRARLWRHRRVGQLARQAGTAWERAAARAAVLDDDVLAEAVPDLEERALLRALRPRLAEMPSGTPATQETVAELCLAEGDEEILWHRVTLSAELEEARESAAHEEKQAAASSTRAASSPAGAARPADDAGPPGTEGRSPELVPRESIARAREEAAREKKRWRPWPRRGKLVSRPAF
ncbi:hypothetical protein GCM10009801_13440 [Streptomyces albiaxialis]|uniref:DNA-binding protein n=2 Tax=Streptomyces albiaxialis TaxID=329523 RepID=A0ABN2VP24_9ACTN